MLPCHAPATTPVPKVDPEPETTDSDATGSEAPGLSRPSSSSGITDADLQPPPGVSWKRSKSKRKLSDKKKKDTDYYALLGLQNERWMATDQQLKLGAWLRWLWGGAARWL
jgi:DnaJ family protein C protein 2